MKHLDHLCRVMVTMVMLACCIPANAADEFKIVIRRGKGTSGKLTSAAAGVQNATCYWKAGKRIPAGVYQGCSTTTMAEKGYKAVFIPNVQGFSGIFIHHGSGPEDSDGCIVTAKTQVEKIWNLVPRDQKNITITIVDE